MPSMPPLHHICSTTYYETNGVKRRNFVQILVKQGDTVSKVIDMIPEVVDKIATAMGKKADVDIDSPEAIHTLR